MNYVEWVEKVLRAFVEMGSDTRHLNGYQQLVAAMAIGGADDAIHTALRDLDDLSLLDASELHWIKENQNTRLVRAGASTRADLWPQIVEISLDPHQVTFLDHLVTLSEQPGDPFADVQWVDAKDVYSALGWEDGDPDMHSLTKSLEDIRLVRRDARLGGFLQVHPTYRGVVRVRERVNTKMWAKIEAMVEEWETSTVDFKERLSLGTEKTNAEFAHDVIALANTKASGRERYLVVGFSDKSHQFTTPFDGSFDQNRLEHILNAFAVPAPSVRLILVGHPSAAGEVSLIEVRRDPAMIPHRMAHDGGKIRAGQVFVRHGTQVEEPTKAELADLEAEGDRARTAL